MSSGWLVAVEMFIVLGLVLGLAIFELWSLRRDKTKTEGKSADKAKGSGANEDSSA
jgi:hypothetical protein